ESLARMGLFVSNPLALVATSPGPADVHPAAVYLARLAPGSRRTMAEALDDVARTLTAGRCDRWTLPWSQLRYQHVQAVRAALAERLARTSVNKALSAVRSTMTEAWRLGLIGAEERARIVGVANLKGEDLPAGRAVSIGELGQLFADCAEDPNAALGARDAAMLGLLYGCGLRRAEAVALDVADYDREAGSLRVQGKGRKERLSYPMGGALAALEAWLAIRGAEAGPLLLGVNKGGHLGARRLSTAAVWAALAARAEQAGVRRFTPHDLRRTFVGELLDAGADVSSVQRLAGHANVSTTVRYDRRPEAAKKRAAGLLQVPYRPRARA
ncbi:MAG TPA: tyrosine-type recombinase/integrase, partial [Actinomycetota bacterium]|nr:tyrosine-type recombinase/integrase [Actinomycetota bacterium]